MGSGNCCLAPRQDAKNNLHDEFAALLLEQ